MWLGLLYRDVLAYGFGVDLLHEGKLLIMSNPSPNPSPSPSPDTNPSPNPSPDTNPSPNTQS